MVDLHLCPIGVVAGPSRFPPRPSPNEPRILTLSIGDPLGSVPGSIGETSDTNASVGVPRGRSSWKHVIGDVQRRMQGCTKSHRGRAKKPRILTRNERWNKPRGWVLLHQSPRKGICSIQWARTVPLPVCCCGRRSADGDGLRQQHPMPRARLLRRAKSVGAIPPFRTNPVPFQLRTFVQLRSPIETGNTRRSSS